MILTAHQPVYLPWMGLFHKIALADKFVHFDAVQYQPKDWNNRNKIKTAQGALWLTVPVHHKGHREMPYYQIEINNSIPWQRKHWRSIALNYRQAPYFQEFAPFFEDVYQRHWQYLVELNDYMLRWLLLVLGIPVEFLNASDCNFAGKKSDLVLNMCQRLGATTYIFGAQGKDYAQIADYEAQGIRVFFQDYQHPQYPQLHGDFISNLSIIDLLFNCGPQSLSIIMAGQKELINE